MKSIIAVTLLVSLAVNFYGGDKSVYKVIEQKVMCKKDDAVLLRKILKFDGGGEVELYDYKEKGDDKHYYFIPLFHLRYGAPVDWPRSVFYNRFLPHEPKYGFDVKITERYLVLVIYYPTRYAFLFLLEPVCDVDALLEARRKNFLEMSPKGKSPMPKREKKATRELSLKDKEFKDLAYERGGITKSWYFSPINGVAPYVIRVWALGSLPMEDMSPSLIKITPPKGKNKGYAEFEVTTKKGVREKVKVSLLPKEKIDSCVVVEKTVGPGPSPQSKEKSGK